jgi:hypothetical protein|tara:strand:+ start:445 stop:627 length:183 start_codon:yes stop_codon:yes gene_type:complete
MIELLKFIEELKEIKEQLHKGKLLAQKETYDVLKSVQNKIDKYEKQVRDFEDEMASSIVM